MATWKILLQDTMKDNGETLSDLVANTLTNEQMLEEFSVDYGSTAGTPFTAWSENYVYFPICYDGSEWVGSVARNPNGQPTGHQGGG